MDNLIVDNGKIIKCMDTVNYLILMEKYVIKVNFKMVCSMVLVLNILMKLILQERSKLIRLSLDLTREVGLNMKGDLKMIKDKDLVKYFLRMEFG